MIITEISNDLPNTNPIREHDLNPETLENIYDELLTLKEEAITNECPIEHSLIIIDDFANDLKDTDLCQKINKAVVETRHLNCS